MTDDDGTQPPAKRETTEHAHGGNFLTTQVGPLPLWGWAVALVGAYLLYRWWKNYEANSAATAAANETTTPSGAPSTTTTPTTTTAAPTTNLGWLASAETSLSALGYSPSLIRTALDRYLSGEQLDAKEEAVIEAAINTLGAPPVAGTFGKEAPAKPKAKPKLKPPQAVQASTHSPTTKT